MNPSGVRLEEKKSDEVRSQSSYRSTQSSRSSVLERAREYNRRLEERRSKSLERSPDHSLPADGILAHGPGLGVGGGPSQLSSAAYPRSRSIGHSPGLSHQQTPQSSSPHHSHSSHSSRSLSAGRVGGIPTHPSRNSTRERAWESVRRDTQATTTAATATASANANPYHSQAHRPVGAAPHHSTMSPRTPVKTPLGSYSHPPHSQQSHTPSVRSAMPQPAVGGSALSSPQASATTATTSSSRRQPHDAQPPPPPAAADEEPMEQPPIITPELLVDALSGHEDGLLAIAEKLMEHYDKGYDVMGEAIIDAFADVQKLFQHVVEAAHMEGAAFEANRREAEAREKKLLHPNSNNHHHHPSGTDHSVGTSKDWDDATLQSGSQPPLPPPEPNHPPTATGPIRHDEFIDQDVKDILTKAIRKGNTLRDANRHAECYDLFQNACQAASALLPVDSDHRGRLQLSLARAESMSHDRACAILRYAMDDVIRSGMRAGLTPLTDPSQRGDVVLTRPKALPSTSGVTGGLVAGVVQSADEALASLMEEMKEILSAPVYNDTPLQGVARRFWTALNEAQKAQQKNEERLEHNLGKLKGEYLLARAEWEEKLNQAQELAESYKDKYQKLKESRNAEGYMEQARSFANRLHEGHPDHGISGENGSMLFGAGKAFTTPIGKASSVASFGSGLAQQAKTLVTQMNNFNCNAANDRNGPIVDDELQNDVGYNPNNNGGAASASRRHHPPPRDSTTDGTPSPRRSRSRSKSTRSQHHPLSRSPQRVDL